MTVPAEVDVLVIGFGAAGASAAITARDAGATLAVVEKTAAGRGAFAAVHPTRCASAASPGRCVLHYSTLLIFTRRSNRSV